MWSSLTPIIMPVTYARSVFSFFSVSNLLGEYKKAEEKLSDIQTLVQGIAIPYKSKLINYRYLYEAFATEISRMVLCFDDQSINSLEALIEMPHLSEAEKCLILLCLPQRNLPNEIEDNKICHIISGDFLVRAYEQGQPLSIAKNENYGQDWSIKMTRRSGQLFIEYAAEYHNTLDLTDEAFPVSFTFKIVREGSQYRLRINQISFKKEKTPLPIANILRAMREELMPGLLSPLTSCSFFSTTENIHFSLTTGSTSIECRPI